MSEVMSEVTITFTDKEDGDVTVSASFNRDVTSDDIEMTGAERVAAGILYRLNNDPEKWLVEEDDT